MKKTGRYIFPALFSLLIYFTVRAVDDTISGFRFWRRHWTITALEIGASLLMGYVASYALQRLFRKFDRELPNTISYSHIAKELLLSLVIVFICINLVLTPMVALTDDGLSWGDFVTINVIPPLFFLVYYSIARSYRLLQVYIHNKLLLEKTTNEHLQTELKFLKAQYHPHFLFNALNTIYFQMDEDILQAKKTVERFSELLRYQLYDQHQTVSLCQEIQYLENFIELQKTRSSDKLQLQVNIDTSLNGEQVYPLLFLPLVENAFKYIGGEYRLHIRFSKQQDELVFVVENSVPAELFLKRTGGIGLENLKRRLELLYPGRHQLNTRQRNNCFVAELKLKTGI
jgi:sensor histidine kinase YesM